MNELEKKARERAKKAAEKIIADLSDRRGLGQEWDQIRGIIQQEIKDKWVSIITAALLAWGNERLEEAIKAVEDAGGDNTEYHSAAIRGLEE